jgi:hypothetical protein
MIGEGRTRTRSSIFWGRRFGPGGRRTGRGSTSLTSVRRWRTTRARRYGRRFGTGSCLCAATSRSKICRGCSTRRSGAGSNITGGIIARHCTRLCGNWTARWPAGPIGSTRSCVVIGEERRTGSHGFPGVIQGCLPTGRWACGVAPQWEPYERRRSCTVLRGREGEIPPRYSPCATSARAPVRAAGARNCTTDEGRPLGTSLQERVPNHLRLLWSKAMVVSAGGKGLGRTRSGDWQEEDRKGTTEDVSKAEGWCQNRGESFPRDQLRRNLLTDGVAPGMKVA